MRRRVKKPVFLPRWRLVLGDGRVVYQCCKPEDLEALLGVFARTGLAVMQSSEWGGVFVAPDGSETHVWPET